MGIHHEVPPVYEDLDGLTASTAPHWRKTDAEENHFSTPPDGEQISRPMIKVAECFVGGDVEALVHACRYLGIPDGERMFTMGNVYEWVGQVRRTSRTGGWVDIGAGHHRSEPQRWMEDVPMDLPDDFERVTLKAFSPTPSVVLLVASFVLTPDAASALDDELHTNRYLRTERHDRSTRFVTAAHRKGEAVRAERARVIEEASTWVAQTFAGTLSRDFKCTTLPNVELLTTRLIEPFTDPQPAGRAGRSDFTTLLSIDTASEAWEARDAPGWRMGMPWRADDARWSIVAACRYEPPDEDTNDEQDALKQAHQKLSPNPNDAYEIGFVFDGLLIRFAAFHLLVQYEHAFGELRDRLATSDSQQTALESLDATHRTLTTLSFDASLVATEFKRWAADSRQWRDECIDPSRARAEDESESFPGLLDILADNLEARGDWILDLEQRIREQLVSRASVLAVSTDLRLQRLVIVVSVVALVIAILSLIRQ